MKLYLDMNPQPNIFARISEDGSCCEFALEKYYVQVPYKPGDEIDWEEEQKGNKITPAVKGFVKSCTPIQRDGRWKWEIETEE